MPCIVCSKPLVDGGEFCPFCGTRVISSSTASSIDNYVQSKVNLELSTRLKDESSFVREIGDKAEDVVWRRLKYYGVLFGIILSGILGFIAFIGIRTLDDVTKRIQPMVADAEKRVETAKRAIDETASKVDTVKASLDQLSRDVDTQTNRVAEKSGEISKKLGTFDSAIDSAQKRVEAYQTHSDELSRRLETITKTLDQQTNRVTQVSKQVDNVSVRQAYPTLGQAKFVTFNSSTWKGIAAKQSNEKWINIAIQPQGTGDYSVDQINKLLADLKGSGYTPLLGIFGLGGPYFTGFYALAGTDRTAVFYFKKEAEQMATDVCATVSRDLSINPLKPQFVNSAEFKDDRRFVIEQSGLDVQIYLDQR